LRPTREQYGVAAYLRKISASTVRSCTSLFAKWEVASQSRVRALGETPIPSPRWASGSSQDSSLIRAVVVCSQSSFGTCLSTRSYYDGLPITRCLPVPLGSGRPRR
jgi:hypothetical protein